MERDFTYIDDVIDGIVGCCKKPAKSKGENENIDNNPSISNAPFEIFNIGNNKPVKLDYFIQLLEEYLGKKAIKNLMPIQQGDVKFTCAEITKLSNWIGYEPKTKIEDGLKNFANWYKNFFELE